MAKIKVREIGKLEEARPDPEVNVSPDVACFGLFDRESDGLQTRLYEMANGGILNCAGSSNGHLIYVWEGEASAGGMTFPRGSIIVVEHGASASLTAMQRTSFLVFCVNQARAAPSRAGGHVHALHSQDAPSVHLDHASNVSGFLLSDAGCPTCELWLHGNQFHDEGFESKPHYHNEDEVIVVTEGEIVLGSRRYGRGTAIAIEKNTIYGFHTGRGGLSFINFRPSAPTYALANQSTPMDERAFFRNLALPEHVYLQ